MKFFDENSIGKLNFLFFFIFWENLLQKIDLSEITPFFYNNFFRFRGGGNFPPSPLATLLEEDALHTLHLQVKLG